MTPKQARKKRGWTTYGAALRMEGVSEQSLKNIEDGTTPPERVQVKTMLEICRVYYPDVQLTDFLGVPHDFKLSPRNANARRKLLYAAA